MDPTTIINNDTLANATVAGQVGIGQVVSSSALFLMSVLSIYFGSIRSLNSDPKSVEVIKKNDATTFPLVASISLMGIYFAFKFLPHDILNLAVKLLFSITGGVSVGAFIHPWFKGLLPKFIHNHHHKIEYTKSAEPKSENETPEVVEKCEFEIETRSFPGYIIGIVIGVCYFLTGHWIANNIISLVFAVNAIKLISLGKFRNGFILLGGLFIYDIFWVFATPVMVTVAKSFDAPIKVNFPQDFLVHGIFGKKLSLLGLGDIVVPGIFVSMLLRFDAHLNRQNSRIYFYMGLFAYSIGLLVTFIVMYTFNHPQPALLYLVPTCLGLPLLLACAKGDLNAMFSYEESEEGAETTVSKTEKKE